MAASISLKDSSCARGAADVASLASFSPGRTVVVYVNGNFAGVKATGPHDLQAYGANMSQVFMPEGNPTGTNAVKAVDNTDGTSATTTVTLT